MIGILLFLFCLAAIVGCERDVREPGEPRVLFNANATSLNAAK